MKYFLLKYTSYFNWISTLIAVTWMLLRFPFTSVLIEIMFIAWALDWVILFMESNKLKSKYRLASILAIGLLTLLLGVVFKIHHLPGFNYLKIMGLIYIGFLPLVFIKKIELPNRHYVILGNYLFFLLSWLSQ